METPSRAWGRRIQGEQGLAHARNTPTGVGKTLQELEMGNEAKKHPHGRGEDAFALLPLATHGETPPRAWGRRRLLFDSGVNLGNTPTGVGKTVAQTWWGLVSKKHPHGRGEDRRYGGYQSGFLRNTPTGVGKTISGEFRTTQD